MVNMANFEIPGIEGRQTPDVSPAVRNATLAAVADYGTFDWSKNVNRDTMSQFGDLVIQTGVVIHPDQVKKGADELRKLVDAAGPQGAADAFQKFMSAKGENMYDSMDYTTDNGLEALTKELNEAFEDSGYEFTSQPGKDSDGFTGFIQMHRLGETAVLSSYGVGKREQA